VAAVWIQASAAVGRTSRRLLAWLAVAGRAEGEPGAPSPCEEADGNQLCLAGVRAGALGTGEGWLMRRRR